MPALDLTLMRAVARDRFRNVSLPAGARRDDYYAYLDALCGAIRLSFEDWRIAATINDVVIMGPTANGGKLRSSASIEGRIRGYAPAGSWDACSRAVAAAIHNKMRDIENLAGLPALPLFPAFAAVPMQRALPLPAAPTSLLTMCTVGLAVASPNLVRDAITQKFPNPWPTAGEGLANAVAEAWHKALVPWLGSTRITGLIGSGHVPSFAPPVSPCGPVVDGRAKMLAGFLL